jgi:hypothetical protein
MLRCPKCGGKELIFLSTTGGFAVGSTDQRYKCKSCGYQGSFVLDTPEPSESKTKGEEKLTEAPKTSTLERAPKPMKTPGTGMKILIVADIILFFAVIIILLSGTLETLLGMAILAVWVMVFLLLFVAYSLQFAEGSGPWFGVGVLAVVAALISILLTMLFELEEIYILVMAPMFIALLLGVSRLFVDNSDEEIDKDLKNLSKEIK